MAGFPLLLSEVACLTSMSAEPRSFRVIRKRALRSSYSSPIKHGSSKSSCSHPLGSPQPDHPSVNVNGFLIPSDNATCVVESSRCANARRPPRPPLSSGILSDTKDASRWPAAPANLRVSDAANVLAIDPRARRSRASGRTCGTAQTAESRCSNSARRRPGVAEHLQNGRRFR